MSIGTYETGPGYGHHRTTPLTRREMIDLINGGESVMVGNRIITRAEHVPSEAQLAVGDPDRERRAMEDIRKEMQRLADTLDELKTGRLMNPGTPQPPDPAQAATHQAQAAMQGTPREGQGGPQQQQQPPQQQAPQPPAAPQQQPQQQAATQGTEADRRASDLAAAQRAALLNPDVPAPEHVADADRDTKGKKK